MREGEQRTTLWTYTPGGKIHTQQKPDGTMLHYAYTPEGELAQVESRTFQYDALGRLIQASGLARQLDPFGNILREDFAGGLSLQSTYDDSNRPLERILPDQSRIVYEYKGPFLKQVTRLSPQGVTLYTHIYEQFDPAGHLLLEKGRFTTSYAYDKEGRRVHQVNPYVDIALIYDSVGNLLQQGDALYTYDNANQLTTAEQQVLRYDTHYNRIHQNGLSLETDSLNQIKTLAYDGNGNQLQAGFAFDPFDQLVQAGGENILYDALGRRLQKGSTSYLYFGEEEVGAFEQGIAKELKIPGLFAPVALEIDGTPSFPITDVQGTIRYLIDQEAAICKKNDCDPFGVGLTAEIPYAYLGKRYDPKTGLVYFGKRYYDPFFGRWLTPDPLGPIDHSNLYQYVFNNPYRFYDPKGESIGGYLLGLGEIVLGGAIIAGGFALEVVTIGGFTLGLGVTISTGTMLMGLGLATTTYHAQDISFDSRSMGGSYVISKNNPGTPSTNKDQNTQANDAKKAIEKLLGRELTPAERSKFHRHVSGQGYGYHEMVEEGYWLLGGS